MENTIIFLTGEVSTGKSSFLNSLAGGIISNTSIQRETFQPEEYIFSNEGDDRNITVLTNQLKDLHEENEQKRSRITTLKEEEIGSSIKKTPDDNFLETKHNLENFHLVDFPGINDAEDTNDFFFKTIENRINICDLLIYVTAAKQAFKSKSEVEYFKKLIALIEKEKEVGHYMDYIVIVNKYDDIDNKDLDDIYHRIIDRAGTPVDKIFRYSSHKMLVNCVINEKMQLIIPKFMKNEVTEILKHADIPLTRTLKKRVKNLQIRYSDIEHIDNSDSSSSDEDSDDEFNATYKGVEGDWDEVMKHIKLFQNNRRCNLVELLKDRFDSLLSHRFIGSCTSYMPDFFTKFNEYVKISQDHIIKYDELLEQVILQYIKILDSTRLDMFIQTLIYNYHDRYISIYDTVMTNKDLINYKTMSLILYKNRKQAKIFSHLYELLKDKQVWCNFAYSMYCIKTNKNISGYSIKKGTHTHPSWFIHILLNDSYKNIQTLLILATTKTHELKSLDKSNAIPYGLIKSIDKQACMRYEYYLSKLGTSESLNHKLFGIDANDMNDWEKYSDKYAHLINYTRYCISPKKK